MSTTFFCLWLIHRGPLNLLYFCGNPYPYFHHHRDPFQMFILCSYKIMYMADTIKRWPKINEPSYGVGILEFPQYLLAGWPQMVRYSASIIIPKNYYICSRKNANIIQQPAQIPLGQVLPFGKPACGEDEKGCDASAFYKSCELCVRWFPQMEMRHTTGFTN